MRLPGPMTEDDFNAALADALQGRVSADTGANDRTQDALEAVAQAAPNPPKRIVDEARRAFEAQRP